MFIGSKQEAEAFTPQHGGERVQEIVVRKEVVYRWLNALKALNINYHDIKIDESQEMQAEVDMISQSLYASAIIIDNEREINIELLVQKEW